MTYSNTPRNTLRKLWATLLMAWLLCTATVPCSAIEQGDGPGRVSLKTEKVVVFKDGYCLFLKTGEGTTDKNGEYSTTEVPDAAVLGSLWAMPAEGQLQSIRSGWVMESHEAKKELPCLHMFDILAANQNRVAQLELSHGQIVTGVIQAVMTQPNPEPVTAAVAAAFGIPAHEVPGTPAYAQYENLRSVLVNSSPSDISHIVTGITGTQFVVRTERGDVLLNTSMVRSLNIEDMQMTLARTLTTSQRTKQMTFRFDAAEKSRKLNMMYFRPGLRWIPTYRIELQGEGAEKKASISLQAEILNEAEPLRDVPLDIVVGVGNFRFRDLPSPLILERVLRNALQQAAPHLMGQGQMNLSNSLYSQRVGEFRRGNQQTSEEENALDLPPELTSAATEDLFLYHLPKLNLDRGERMAAGIFQAKNITCRDVYTWDVRVKRLDRETAPSSSEVDSSPLTLSSNQVWHQVELVNSTAVPWTTGAALLMKDQQPLAQELLTYTSPGSTCRIPVTVAVDTRASYEEQETGRELRALSWDGSHYARIEKEISLELRNNKKTPIRTEITVRLGGRATQASEDGNITVLPFDAADWSEYRGHASVNNSSSIRWRVTIEPQQTFRAQAKYHYFARH
jgi:hypothetical protein